MNRQQVAHVLSAHRAELKRLGIGALSLFGSVVRNEATAASDVDFLIEFDHPVGLFEFFRVQHRLEQLLGVEKVDLLTPAAIKPSLKQQILSEAIRVA